MAAGPHLESASLAFEDFPDPVGGLTAFAVEIKRFWWTMDAYPYGPHHIEKMVFCFVLHLLSCMPFGGSVDQVQDDVVTIEEQITFNVLIEACWCGYCRLRVWWG